MQDHFIEVKGAREPGEPPNGVWKKNDVSRQGISYCVLEESGSPEWLPSLPGSPKDARGRVRGRSAVEREHYA